MREGITAFIGAGNMAEALIGGVLDAGVMNPAQIRVADIASGRREHVGSRFKVAAYADNAAAVADADLVILAVKPAQVAKVLDELRDVFKADALLVSIAAGVRTGFMEARLRPGTRVVRVMPNTAVLVRKGAGAYCRGSRATARDARLVESIFNAVGMIRCVRESELDAVTAVSGSGPAYVFHFMEAMQAAAVRLGLEQAVARDLILATLEGAAQLLLKTGLPPEELRRRVTSPGGTTEAAIQILEQQQVKQALAQAIIHAAERSHELSEKID